MAGEFGAVYERRFPRLAPAGGHKSRPTHGCDRVRGNAVSVVFDVVRPEPLGCCFRRDDREGARRDDEVCVRFHARTPAGGHIPPPLHTFVAGTRGTSVCGVFALSDPNLWVAALDRGTG